MRQLMFLGPGRVEWQETAEPAVGGPLEAIVAPVAVATCDLDVAILRGTFRAFPGKFPLGHEGVARVTEVGEGVTSVSPGDLVVVPFQISCGTCPACRADRTGNCASVPLGSMYGYEPFGGPWGGFLADRVRVPYADAMLVRLKPPADPAAVASLSDNVCAGGPLPRPGPGVRRAGRRARRPGQRGPDPARGRLVPGHRGRHIGMMCLILTKSGVGRTVRPTA